MVVAAFGPGPARLGALLLILSDPLFVIGDFFRAGRPRQTRDPAIGLGHVIGVFDVAAKHERVAPGRIGFGGNALVELVTVALPAAASVRLALASDAIGLRGS